MIESRPFILYTDSEREAARQSLQAICQNWCADWFVSAAVKNFALQDCSSNTLPEPANWQVHNQGDSVLLLDHSSKVHKAIAVALAGKAAVLEPPRLPLTPLVAEVVSHALEDLAGMLEGRGANGLLTEKSAKNVKQILSEASAVGSGFLLMKFELDNTVFSCVIPQPLAQRWVPLRDKSKKVMPAAAELLPLQQAVAQRSIRAKVVLGHCDLTLGDIAALEIGNVILLDDHLLNDKPPDFELQTLDGELISPIQIGKQGPHAVAIITRNH